MIKKTSPRPSRKSSGTSSSSDLDSYKHEIAEKHSTDDGNFWGRKPVASRMRSSSTNSDSSNESGSQKDSRENSPEITDVRRKVGELKEIFAKRLSTEELPTGKISPMNQTKVSPEVKPVMRTKPQVVSDHDSPNIPLRPRQSEIFRAHFANAFTSKTSTTSTSSMSPVEEELDESSVVPKGKSRKTPPPTPPRKDSKPTMPDVPPKTNRRSIVDPRMTTPPDQLPRSKSHDDTHLQDKAMEAILKVLIQKNGPELQDLVKQAIASDPDLLKLALANNN